MSVIDIVVPDIGDFSDVEVIEVMVKEGDVVAAEQSLVTVESDKASMEIPCTAAGKIVSLTVKVGDKVSKGSVLGKLEEAGVAQGSAAGAPSAPAPAPASASQAAAAVPAPAAAPPVAVTPAAAIPAAVEPRHPAVPADLQEGAIRALPHASPSVRMLARELGVDLHAVRGTGPKDRILADDVKAFVKNLMSSGALSAGSARADAGGAALGLLPWPKVDFEKYGPVERKPLSRIKKISGANLHRNWVMIPHVTNHEDADITGLEDFRVRLNAENAKAGIKLTMLAFLVKASVAALKKFPEFNASLDGETLVYKNYYHIGFAADTPNGLVVPVIKDADRKGVLEIAVEMAELARKARDGKLGPADMQGGTFSISSLGGIGGTYFTPIINAPEVAILGVCRSAKRPVWDEGLGEFVPRLILPLSLSWDHRVIDGAAAARFAAYLAQVLADFRRVML
ncbi:MAG: dihydrolipoyllysine-residue acetyltransferase [Lautropia sp.]|nr:dihydrolipoyllysine-residue acetyltransferase [Lautropia sp.]